MFLLVSHNAVLMVEIIVRIVQRARERYVEAEKMKETRRRYMEGRKIKDMLSTENKEISTLLLSSS